VTAASPTPDGRCLRVEWADGSSASFPAAFLQDSDYSVAALEAAAAAATPAALTERVAVPRRTPPARPLPTHHAYEPLGKEDLPRHDFSELLGSDAALAAWLGDLNEWGLTLVRGAPLESGTVARLAARVDRPMHTIYGETWDVEATPEPINIGEGGRRRGARYPCPR
jgi:hypothetical protein